MLIYNFGFPIKNEVFALHSSKILDHEFQVSQVIRIDNNEQWLVCPQSFEPVVNSANISSSFNSAFIFCSWYFNYNIFSPFTTLAFN